MKTRKITAGVIMAALALLLTVLPVSFPFPPIPYLRFDPAEIPVFTAVLAFGPVVGMLSTFVYYLALLAVGEFTPIGPTLKFLAVAPSFLGFYFAGKLVSSRGPTSVVVSGAVLATVLRVLVTTAANYVVLVVMFPDFLSFATMALSAFTGTKLSPDIQGLFLVLTFTAIFNILHIVFSTVPSFLVIKALNRSKALQGMWTPWIVNPSPKRSGPGGT
jgi:riboflavin transporter FmnP